MKTLVIHPKDKSTEFLTEIYKNIPHKNVVSGGVTKYELAKLIGQHDRIIMCGHGTGYGLLSVGQFPTRNGFIIDWSFVYLLSKRKECIYIWCNSDKFVNEHKLKGFYSGMFVSEVGESKYCDIPSTQQVVTDSNDTFSKIMSKYINKSVKTIYQNVKDEYGKFSMSNRVGYYNNERLYLNE
jgi:hypothetical protein